MLFLKIHKGYYLLNAIQFPSVYPKQHCSEHPCTFSVCTFARVLSFSVYTKDVRYMCVCAYLYIYELPRFLSAKECACQAEDTGSISGMIP